METGTIKYYNLPDDPEIQPAVGKIFHSLRHNRNYPLPSVRLTEAWYPIAYIRSATASLNLFPVFFGEYRGVPHFFILPSPRAPALSSRPHVGAQDPE